MDLAVRLVNQKLDVINEAEESAAKFDVQIVLFLGHHLRPRPGSDDRFEFLQCDVRRAAESNRRHPMFGVIGLRRNAIG